MLREQWRRCSGEEEDEEGKGESEEG